MDTPAPPKILANRVIQQMVDHMVADGPVLEAKDFMVIRTTYRSLGGKWTDILGGDKAQLELLKKTVEAWASTLPPPKKDEMV